MTCRIVLAQTNPRLGDQQANLADHVERVRGAAQAGAQVVLFPELSLAGYFLKDQVADLALTLESPELARLAELSAGISIGVGFAERTPAGRFHNSYAFLEDGRVLGVHRKVHLVTYGLFDEARDFAAGEEFRIFPSKHGRFGPLICEDLWHVPSSYVHFLNDADALLVPSASPLRGMETPGPGPSSARTWEALLVACAVFYRTWVLYVGRVGWEDGIGFAGGSSAFDPFGNRVATLGHVEPGELEVAFDRSVLDRARLATPLRRDEKPWILARALADHVPLLDVLRGGGTGGAAGASGRGR